MTSMKKPVSIVKMAKGLICLSMLVWRLNLHLNAPHQLLSSMEKFARHVPFLSSGIMMIWNAKPVQMANIMILMQKHAYLVMKGSNMTKLLTNVWSKLLLEVLVDLNVLIQHHISMDNFVLDVFYHITGVKMKNCVNLVLIQPTTTKNKESVLHVQMVLPSMKTPILV